MGSARKRRTEDYDPELGRFITEDSFLGNLDEPPSLHRYLYANDRPTFFVDPSGHESVLPHLAELDKPGTIANWKQEVFKKDPTRFADALTEDEGAYLDHFKVQKLDPSRLNEVQIKEARTLFGDNKDAFEQYTNYQARSQLIFRYALNDPRTIAYLGELYRTTRDLNPTHFVGERLQQVATGEEAFTGEQTGRLRPTLELAAAYGLGKLANVLIGKALEPGPFDTRVSPRTSATSEEVAGTEPAARATPKRLQYMGRTPGKGSRTGREVIEAMKQAGRIIQAEDGSLHLVDQGGKTVPLTTTDMGHLEDAVKWWNREGYQYGPKSDPVRKWMLDPKNYELQPSSVNRSKGAQLPDRYRAPETPH